MIHAISYLRLVAFEGHNDNFSYEFHSWYSHYDLQMPLIINTKALVYKEPQIIDWS